MDGRWGDVLEMMNKQAVMDTFVDILLCAVPIWVAVMIGLVIGWSWRPRWTGLVFLGLRSRKLRFVWTVPPGLGARRLWLAFTALSAFSVARRLWFRFYGRDGKEGEVAASAVVEERADTAAAAEGSTYALTAEGNSGDIIPVSGTTEAPRGSVTEHDLEHFMHLLDGKDGEMAWQSMMERSTQNMTYQAWRHEAESGLIVYRSRTVFEDATPELVRDFFWDDEYRPKWDPMLAYVKILEECPQTGMMIVHWIKKFPFFCSDREYIIGRRIWEAGRTFYCVTKGLPYAALPRRDKPRRVDLYFSSWIIRPVQSLKGDGQLSACEVTLIHYEDMGIPKDVAKLGVRHGMWGTVKKLHNGFRSYQNARNTDPSLSRCALMARVATNVSTDEGSNSEEPMAVEEARSASLNVQAQQGPAGIDWKWLVVGGTVALVCGLHTGVIGKALLLGAGQRVARRQRNPR